MQHNIVALQVEKRCCTYYHPPQTLSRNKILLLQVEKQLLKKVDNSTGCNMLLQLATTKFCCGQCFAICCSYYFTFTLIRNTFFFYFRSCLKPIIEARNATDVSMDSLFDLQGNHKFVFFFFFLKRVAVSQNKILMRESNCSWERKCWTYLSLNVNFECLVYFLCSL